MDRCPLAPIGFLHRVAWGQVVLRYTCVLVCCYKQLDSCIYTAFYGICINIETLLESFFDFFFNFFLFKFV